jgi:hypothetical protein
MMFRRLPPIGGDPRNVAEIVNNIMDGKTNNTGTITLATGNATSTTLYDARISPDTKIILIPFSDAAEQDSAPYGQFFDFTDQTATSLGTAQVMSYSTEDLNHTGVYLSDSTKINFRNAGVYAVQYSIQFKNTTNSTQSVNIWYRRNGSDYSGSNSMFGMPPRKSSGNPSHLIAVTTLFLELSANDYLELAWHPSDLGVTIEHFAAVTASPGVTPDIPETPSIFLTVQCIAPTAYSNIYVSAQQNGQATISHYANSTANKTYAYILVG